MHDWHCCCHNSCSMCPSLARNMLQDDDATLCTVADALVYATISGILESTGLRSPLFGSDRTTGGFGHGGSKVVTAIFVTWLVTTPTKQGRRGGRRDKGGKLPRAPQCRRAPRSLRMIFLSPFTGNTKADNSEIFNFALLSDICTGQLLLHINTPFPMNKKYALAVILQIEFLWKDCSISNRTACCCNTSCS